MHRVYLGSSGGGAYSYPLYLRIYGRPAHCLCITIKSRVHVAINLTPGPSIFYPTLTLSFSRIRHVDTASIKSLYLLYLPAMTPIMQGGWHSSSDMRQIGLPKCDVQNSTSRHPRVRFVGPLLVNYITRSIFFYTSLLKHGCCDSYISPFRSCSSIVRIQAWVRVRHGRLSYVFPHVPQHLWLCL